MFDERAGGARQTNMMNSFRGNQGTRGLRRKVVRHSSAKGAPSDNSSRYINTDHKRDQISTRGGQANIRISMADKKKSRPKTAGRTRAAKGAPRP